MWNFLHSRHWIFFTALSNLFRYWFFARLGQALIICMKLSQLFPANIRLDEDVLKTSWRRLLSSSSEDVLKMSSRRLHQDEYVHLSHTSSRRLQDVFKASSRRLAKKSSRCFQNVFKTFRKTSSRHLQDVLQKYIQDVFKMHHQVKLFLLTRLWETFNTFLRRSFPKTVIYRGICQSNNTSDKFMVSVPNLQER